MDHGGPPPGLHQPPTNAAETEATVAEKAASVRVFDLKGICPQHVTMIGIFGDIADVNASVKAIKEAEHLK